MRWLGLLMAALALPALAVEPEIPTAAPLGFEARVEPSTAELGRPFVYEIRVRHHPAERYELPRPLSLGTAAIRNVDVSRSEAEGEATTIFRVEAAIYDQLGEANLPDLVLSVRGPDGVKELPIPGAPVTIAVSSEAQELAGNRPPRELIVPSYFLLWSLLALVGAVVLGLLARRHMASRRGPVDEGKAPPRIPADERTLAELRKLAAETLPREGKAREHYFRLSAIVRAYLGEVADFSAPDMTSFELLEALRARSVPGLPLADFERWLERSDLARFAKAEIDPSIAVADLELATAWVREIAGALRREAEKAASEGDAREGAA